MKRIGITIDAKRESIWTNGINQNAIYLAMVLQNAGYKPYLISHDSNNKNMESQIKNLGFNLYGVEKASKIPFDLIIQLGLTFSESIFAKFKKTNKKVKLVSYKCGNQLIVDMESILFSANKSRWESSKDESIDATPDQIWSIPQMENTNLDYYKLLLKQKKATVVPFIWDPIAIETYNQEMNHKGYDVYSKRDIKNLAIMEPNLSVMKNTLHPIISAELLYEDYKLDSVMMVGSAHIKTNKRFLQILKQTLMFKDGVMSADDRHPTLVILNKYSDMVLSWQWENNLNYLYLDVAWMGWPVVHNANLCQDVGYYYEGFNAEDARDKMKLAIETHNDDTEYLQRNREIIKRYTKENDHLVDQYIELIEDVLNNRFKKRAYDWKTNSIS